MKSTSTIDKLYDQYKLQDWGLDENIDNLNPKREMLISQVKQIEHAIQELTDDIVRKKIVPKTEQTRTLATAFGGDSANNLEKNIASINAGSTDGTIFGNGFSSDIEEQIALLEAELEPVVVDCEQILKRYGFDVSESEIEEEDDGEDTFVVSTVNSSNTPDDYNLDEEDESVEKCAEIDLTILKIFIAILKIFKLIVKIITFILELPMIIAEIVQLISQCWINPPSISLVVMIILDLVTSIILAIISMLIQFLWNLLGLDCIAVQSTEMLDKISDIISAFKNTAAKIDIGTVNFLFDGVSNEINSLTDLIKKSIKDFGEDWNDAVNQFKNYFSEDGLKSLKDAAVDTAVNTLLEEYSRATDGNTNSSISQGIEGATRSLANGTIIEDAKNKAINEYNKMKATYESAIKTASSTIDNIKASFARMQDSGNKLGELIADISVGELEIE